MAAWHPSMKNHTIYLTNPLDLDFWDISNFSLLQRTTCAFNLLLFESLHLELLPQEVFLEVEFLEVNHSECLSVCPLHHSTFTGYLCSAWHRAQIENKRWTKYRVGSCPQGVHGQRESILPNNFSIGWYKFYFLINFLRNSANFTTSTLSRFK